MTKSYRRHLSLLVILLLLASAACEDDPARPQRPPRDSDQPPAADLVEPPDAHCQHDGDCDGQLPGLGACERARCDTGTGVCVAAAVVCDSGAPCTRGACDEDTGECAYSPLMCDDGDLCTTGACDDDTDTCVFTPIVCDDGNPCTDNTCDPATGCVFVHNAADCDAARRSTSRYGTSTRGISAGSRTSTS
jgi:hypothetical protein